MMAASPHATEDGHKRMGPWAKRIGVVLACLVLQEGAWHGLAASPKIHPILNQTLARMTHAGITRDSMGAYDLTQFSNPLVRIDEQGRVQVEIDVDRLDAAAIRELVAAAVLVEHANSQYRIVQGLVPFYLIERVAQLANVKRIRPPVYAVPRGRMVSPPASGNMGQD